MSARYHDHLVLRRTVPEETRYARARLEEEVEERAEQGQRDLAQSSALRRYEQARDRLEQVRAKKGKAEDVLKREVKTSQHHAWSQDQAAYALPPHPPNPPQAG